MPNSTDFFLWLGGGDFYVKHLVMVLKWVFKYLRLLSYLAFSMDSFDCSKHFWARANTVKRYSYKVLYES